MTVIFSSINGQKRLSLPAVIAAVIFMSALSLFPVWPDFVWADDSKATPDEQKVLQWLEEYWRLFGGDDDGYNLWLEKAYESGETAAAAALGDLYFKKVVVLKQRKKEDIELAEKWLLIAAEYDDVQAVNNIIILHYAVASDEMLNNYNTGLM